MNITHSDTPPDMIPIDTGAIFIMVAFMLFIVLAVHLFRLVCSDQKVIPVVQGVQVIEIPIAVNISIQTVDNEHVGIVL